MSDTTDKPYIPIAKPEDFQFRFAPKKLAALVDVGVPISFKGKDDRISRFNAIEVMRPPRKKYKVTGVPRLKRNMRMAQLSEWYNLDSKFFPNATMAVVKSVCRKYSIRMRAQFVLRRWWAITQNDKQIGNGTGSGVGYLRIKEDVIRYRKENPENKYEIVAGVRVFRSW